MLCLVWWNWLVFGLVCLFILCCPLIYHLTNKEEPSCEEKREMEKQKKAEEEEKNKNK